MLSEDAITDTANKLLKSKGLQVTKCKMLQNLWAGYGHIARIEPEPIDKTCQDKPQSLILKVVSPPNENGKRQNIDEGHLRKLISYQVEQHFYTDFALKLPAEIAPVAKCVASVNENETNRSPTIAMVLTDLKETFAVEGEKRGELSETQVCAALRWLAGFHGFWWRKAEGMERGRMRLPPLEEVRLTGREKRDGLWLNGGYTYLATRKTEYESLQDEEDSEWSSALCTPMPENKNKNKSTVAELVAQVLAPSADPPSSSPTHPYETIIHGDVKSENLFANSSGDEVAFFDFQYVGLGLGVCDLAKLFTCSVPMSLLTSSPQSSLSLDMQDGERKLLEYYRQMIESVSGKTYPWDVLIMHWKTALVDWLRFQASWGFWGNTDWLEDRVRCVLDDRDWRAWVVKTAEEK